MANGPKLWKKLLNESPKGSVLMGGAVVDYACAVEPKDYDIFHTYKPGEPETPANWVKTEADFNDPAWVEEHQELYMQGVPAEIKFDELNIVQPHVIGSVYEYLVDGEYKVQLIGVHYEDPLKHFKNFDHSLTLAYFSQKALYVSRKVLDSVDAREITYVGKNKSADAKKRSLVRALNKAHRYGWDDFITTGFHD